MVRASAVRVEGSVANELEGLRGPITAFCYRMLGSPHEAEDAAQETMVRAWRSLGSLKDRSGLRAWVYRIATNVCIDAANARRARALPMDLVGADGGGGEMGVPLAESVWVQPVPSRMVGADDPLERAVSRDTIRLAFVAALQHLLPRQRAVLILRDVLRWRAAEVAALLDTSADAVNSTLRRARAALAEARGTGSSSPPAGGPIDARLLETYVDAFERFDVDRIVSLLHRDAVVSMPPFSFWLRGRDSFRQWLQSSGVRCRYARVMPIEANGGPAVALWRGDADGGVEPAAIHVLDGRGGRLTALHAFLEPSLFPVFSLVPPTGRARTA